MLSNYFSNGCNECKFNNSCCKGYGKSPCCYCDVIEKCSEQNPKRNNFVKVEVDEND